VSIAADPGINAETVRTWIRAADKATPRAVTPAPAAAKPALEAENEALRRKVRELEEERDTLRRTAKYLERAIVGLAQQPFP
jgi:transposase